MYLILYIYYIIYIIYRYSDINRDSMSVVIADSAVIAFGRQGSTEDVDLGLGVDPVTNFDKHGMVISW